MFFESKCFYYVTLTTCQQINALTPQRNQQFHDQLVYTKSLENECFDKNIISQQNHGCWNVVSLLSGGFVCCMIDSGFKRVSYW